MMSLNRVLVVGAVALLGMFSVPSCSSKIVDGTDSNTHWLEDCSTSSQCGSLECLCGKCTKHCDAASACGDLGARASCEHPAACSNQGTGVCLSDFDAGSASTGGTCPASARGGDACDGSTIQCWTPCTNGMRGQLVCSGGHWVAGKGLFPCGNPSDACVGPCPGPQEITCPANIVDGGACGPNISGCTTACNGGFNSHYDCINGRWLAGHGLFSCGDAGGAAPCAPMDAHTGPLPCASTIGYAWDGTGCKAISCSCEGKDCSSIFPDEATCQSVCFAQAFGCTTNDDCVLTSHACCPASCGVQHAGDVIAVSKTSVAAWSASVCAPGQSCPPCVPSNGTLRAWCFADRCQTVDIGGCRTNLDCVLTSRACCPASCGVQHAEDVIAISADSRAAWATLVCAPGQSCGCVPPDGTLRARCLANQCETVDIGGPDATPF